MNLEVEKTKDKPIITNVLGNKILNKKFSLQFLPMCFDNIKDKKHILYKEYKLKVDYLIDLIHTLILKYYFKKENTFKLNALVLKDKYGYLYNHYINYLKETKIIKLKKNYRKGVSSRIYELNLTILDHKTQRYKNYDKFLLKKAKKRIFNTDLTPDINELIGSEIKIKLIDDLYDVKIDDEKAYYFLENTKNDLDIYNRNAYAVDSINNSHIFFHFDNYGRMHTNYTILKNFIRKNCLLIDGEKTSEIDISNSQPLFLSKLINDSQTNWVNVKEMELFKELTKRGVFYDYMLDNIPNKTRNEMKEMTYKVLFGRNHDNNKADINFRSVFPTIHNFIKLYKKDQGNYKILAYDLQRMESNLIFNKIIRRIMNYNPNIKIITIHDSIIVQSKYKDVAEKIFIEEKLKEFDF